MNPWQGCLTLRTTQISLAHLMQHLVNHSTYHRGQVALMMRQLAADPFATDFHVFLVEGRRQTADAHYNTSHKWPRRDVLVIEECPGAPFEHSNRLLSCGHNWLIAAINRL
jgi:hypothetical protein